MTSLHFLFLSVELIVLFQLHAQGKTEQAKTDMARLAKIRAEREAAAAQRKAEAEGELRLVSSMTIFLTIFQPKPPKSKRTRREESGLSDYLCQCNSMYYLYHYPPLFNIVPVNVHLLSIHHTLAQVHCIPITMLLLIFYKHVRSPLAFANDYTSKLLVIVS